jgi:hypothetical protein
MSFHVGQRVVCVCVNFSREPVWRGTIRVFANDNSPIVLLAHTGADATTSTTSSAQ